MWLNLRSMYYHRLPFAHQCGLQARLVSVLEKAVAYVDDGQTCR